jgi:DNA transposition AAA+ family ATPase
MITTEFKQRIRTKAKERLEFYGSANKMAVALGINSAQLSRFLKGELDNVVSDANLISIARKLDVQLREDLIWKTAETPVYMYIYTQLKACRDYSLSGLLCDIADIGKTHTAKCFVKENKNVVYVDCSQVKTKQKLIRQIAIELGLGHTGKYSDVYGDLVFYLRSIPNPLIILDEAGDLDYPAFLELKALWNATEGCCGWFMMGADGLKTKIDSNLGRKKVGYTEIFSRFGSTYQKITPDGKEAIENFTYAQIALITKANNENVDIKGMIAKANGSLRRVRIELQKQKAA